MHRMGKVSYVTNEVHIRVRNTDNKLGNYQTQQLLKQWCQTQNPRGPLSKSQKCRGPPREFLKFLTSLACKSDVRFAPFLRFSVERSHFSQHKLLKMTPILLKNNVMLAVFAWTPQIESKICQMRACMLAERWFLAFWREKIHFSRKNATKKAVFPVIRIIKCLTVP